MQDRGLNELLLLTYMLMLLGNLWVKQTRNLSEIEK